MLARSQRRAGTAALTMLALVLSALCLWSSPARAASDATTTTAKCPTPELLARFSATGATVTTPGAKPRKLDKDQATAFMQTWLAYSVFQNPPQERPPAGVPVSRLDVATTENGQPGSLLIFYATDGTEVWVGAPAPVAAPPPNDEKWIRVPKPEQATAAFEGKMAPICTTPPTSASTTATSTVTTVGQATKPSGTSSSSGTPWALIVVAIAVIVGGGAFVAIRSRRRRPA